MSNEQRGGSKKTWHSKLEARGERRSANLRIFKTAIPFLSVVGVLIKVILAIEITNDCIVYYNAVSL